MLLIVAAFAFTRSFVNLHRSTELSLARRWFTRGEQAMQMHLAGSAAEDYRTALNYDRNNPQYRLRLAQSLFADNRWAEARAHLISLWEREPADGEVNLTLARLEAGRSDYRQAQRYYYAAIDGVWQENPRKSRSQARFELASYLIKQNKMPGAQAELLALLADSPSDPADQLLLGKMLLEVNDPAHALQAYQLLLSKDTGNSQAWLGESEAYLRLGNYVAAERASARAVDRDPKLDAARQQLELTRELLRVAPGQRGVPMVENAARVANAFQAAMKRLGSCAATKNISLTATPAAEQTAAESVTTTAPAPNTLQLLYERGIQKQHETSAKALQNNPDAMEPTMQFVFEVEQATQPACPTMDLIDRALLILAQHESSLR